MSRLARKRFLQWRPLSAVVVCCLDAPVARGGMIGTQPGCRLFGYRLVRNTEVPQLKLFNHLAESLHSHSTLY